MFERLFNSISDWFENLEHSLTGNELSFIVIEGPVRMKPLITVIPHRGDWNS